MLFIRQGSSCCYHPSNSIFRLERASPIRSCHRTAAAETTCQIGKWERRMSQMRQCMLMISLVLLALLPGARLSAQNKGEPGKFDFYLLNLSWSPEFCSILGTSSQCRSGRGFIVHGLWPQNNDGSYPVFCSNRPGPQNPRVNLDITPDLSLLQHEWDKHGTCTELSPKDFFAEEHKAFHTVKIPPLLENLDHPIQMRPSELLRLFSQSNPSFPNGSILISCGNNRLTAVEACFSKDLSPIACRGLRSCRANVVKVLPPS